MQINLGRDDDGRRADRIVRRALSDISLSTVYRLFRQSRVKLGARTLAPEDRLSSGDILLVFLPEDFTASGTSGDARHETHGAEEANMFDAASLRRLPEAPRILWESEDLAAFHKPRGMLTHDGAASLDAFAKETLRRSIPPSASFSPGPLHRLDRNTSGIIMFSKSRYGAEIFSAAVREHKVRKLYVGLASGRIETEMFLEDKLVRDGEKKKTIAGRDGRAARLRLRPLARGEEATLVLIELFTGLTHQIRAQLGARGHPLCGDTKYGGDLRCEDTSSARSSGYFLHAHSLVFPTFLLPDLPAKISDPLPAEFASRAFELMRLDEKRSKPAPSNGGEAWKSSIDTYILSAIEATM